MDTHKLLTHSPFWTEIWEPLAENHPNMPVKTPQQGKWEKILHMLIKFWNNFSNSALRWVKGVIMKVTYSFLPQQIDVKFKFNSKQNYDAWVDGNFKMCVTFKT